MHQSQSLRNSSAVRMLLQRMCRPPRSRKLTIAHQKNRFALQMKGVTVAYRACLVYGDKSANAKTFLSFLLQVAVQSCSLSQSALHLLSS